MSNPGINMNCQLGAFPGGPVVKTLCSQYREKVLKEPGNILGPGDMILSQNNADSDFVECNSLAMGWKLIKLLLM